MIPELGWCKDQGFRVILCHINYFETRMGCMLKTLPQRKFVCGCATVDCTVYRNGRHAKEKHTRQEGRGIPLVCGRLVAE